MNKIVVFDIWADYAHFRVPYTTSSPITYPIPPKTAIYGIIAAIMGYDKNSYLQYFQNKIWKVGVSIKKPIKIEYIPENFVDTKRAKLFGRMPKNKPCRTQINLEFLKNPFYRFYVTCKNEEELNALADKLKEHKSIFTVSLGLSECIANFIFIGIFELEKRTDKDFVEISSIIPLENISKPNQIDFLSENSKFLQIHIPLEMKPDRELVKSGYFLIEANGKKIKLKDGEFYHVRDLNDNIFLF
ncbi:type I-B CRISPR-associated protein Cas5b [Deferribacterales bacterium Es71-Z0220]|jgi:CRISPR-associated protein Cas5h|uniref:type I-B CRISPR-associated protein Cas5b n=1 Tax=Deferrivibrio essentukiensis TaxID=2880922 RepID=UPI001F60557E|nr:type I-B CRISPR-associated protein Cas5b [Deferrivibrio essentukiensis]MCB4205477.1 type I-B CRISPR-associated protein Cas5b [Deferrivibrio essentukiensis]